MAILDHWHPVLPSRQLRCEPVGVRLAGRCLVLFRDHANRIGALADECPHRRMRLKQRTHGKRPIAMSLPRLDLRHDGPRREPGDATTSSTGH